MELYYLVFFPVSHKQILITHILIKSWRQVCSQPDYLERYFTKVGVCYVCYCIIQTLDFFTEVISGDYFFVYASDEIMLLF